MSFIPLILCLGRLWFCSDMFVFWEHLAPVVQRPDKFILWISHYPTVSICANISVFLLVQANMHTPTTVKFGRVLKPCSTFNVKYSLDTE